jgi:hypothetical protein
MLLTQKYHSAKDIDPEFIPSLEELLSECVPSFNWLKSFEESAPENTHFAYYLFFGTQHNSPVGFAQVSLEGEEKEKTLFSHFFKQKTLSHSRKKAYWKMPGSLNEGIIFQPMYIKEAANNTKNIFKEYLDRKDIEAQSLCFSKALYELEGLKNESRASMVEKTIPGTLIKTANSYENYLSTLEDSLQTQIKKMWRSFYKEELKLGEYSNLKEVFSYRKGTNDVYKKIKSNPVFKQYKNEKCIHLTVEKDNAVLAIIFFIKGHGGHYFFDTFSLDKSVDEMMLCQLTIMKFYEIEDSSRLHLMNKSDSISLYQSLGFSLHSQIHMNVHPK